jgi:hypothetical protein
LNFGALSDGTLYHIVGTWNVSTGAGQAFKDGSLFGSGTSRNGVSNGVMSFGARGTSNPFEGELYDIRIYNRVLAAPEVQTIYNARGMDGIVAGLLHRWLMNEGQPGASLSGTGTVKDHASGQINVSVGTGTAPVFIYDGLIQPRRRVA